MCRRRHLLGPGKIKVFAQELDQKLAGLNRPGIGLSVDLELNGNTFSMISGMMLSGINVAHLNRFAVSPPDEPNLDRPFNQGADQSAFVLG